MGYLSNEQARTALECGATMDAMLLTEGGLVAARGKLTIEGGSWSAVRDAMCTDLQVQYQGERFTAPLVRPVRVQSGHPVHVKLVHRDPKLLSHRAQAQ